MLVTLWIDIFEKVVEGKVAQDDQQGCFKVFPNIQDHLGQAQCHRQPGVGREQGRPQGLISGQSCCNKGCSASKTWLV